ncbi:MAG: RNA-binding S4 domain-containing protein [Burkholderiales bacterium]|nr:RNA-binding S4 domain-containing protein [Burkholderiales bacterium]
MTTPTPIRLDKWLWAARFFKTRSLAAHAIEAGRVRINGDKVKVARTVSLGMLLQIDNGSTRWEVEVLGLSDVRGSAPVAQALYLETAESIQQRANDAEQRKFQREPALARVGRPTKQDRRALERVQYEKNALD